MESYFELYFRGGAVNLGPKIAYIDASQADPLPQHLVIGTAYEVVDTQYHDVLLSMDLYKPLIADGSFVSNLFKAWADDPMSDEFKEIDLHVGGEYKYGLSAQKDDAFFALRAGYSLDHDGGAQYPYFRYRPQIQPVSNRRCVFNG